MPLSVLMISIDKGLLGRGQLGDVVQRHIAYGEQAGVRRLDIVVLCRGTYETHHLSAKVTATPTNSASRLRYLRDGVRCATSLAANLAPLRYDLIVTQEPLVTAAVGLAVRRQSQARLLVHHHGDYFGNPAWLNERPLRHRLLRAWAKRHTRQADAVRAMSRGIADKLAALGIDRRRIRVIPTPVNLAQFGDQRARDRAQGYRVVGRQIVLTVGRNDRAKDFPTLYRAIGGVAARVPGLLFWQVGAAGVTEAAVRAVVGANLDVRVTSQIDQRELAAGYHASDVMVSSSAHESFGKVLVEANACGKPVVATATTGAKDIVEDGVNGFLVPVGDAQALAEKIVYLLQHPGQARAMGERGRALVAERFDGRKNTEAIIQFWQDIVEERL